MKLKNIRIIMIVYMIMFTVNAQSQTAIKRPLVEEYTGTWCSSCAFGNVYFDHLATLYPNAIPVAIHSGDVMENFAITNYMTEYFSALPTFLYDRIDFPSNPGTVPAVSAFPWVTGLDTLDNYLDMIYNETPIATIGIDQSYNEVTREISVTITSHFIENASGDFRLNCFIIEDSISGGPDYNQSNSNFSGWTGGPSYLQDLIDSPSQISGYYHNHVVREMLGTPVGITASIPTTVSNGSSYSKTFTYTLPIAYDENQISLVGIVQRYGPSIENDRNIVNANSQHLGEEDSEQTNSIPNLKSNILNLSVYPNPIDETSKIEFYVKETGTISCTLINSLGEELSVLFDKNFTQGEYRINFNQLNLSSGIYYLTFYQNGLCQTEKIVVNN